MTPRTLRLVGGAFHAFLPEAIELGALGLYVFGRLQREFQGRGLQSPKHLLGRESVQRCSREALAGTAAVDGVPASADVAVSFVAAVIVHRHAGTAIAADHQPLQKRVAVPRRASGVRYRPVVLQLPQVLLVGLPAYVGRQPVLEKDVPPPDEGEVLPAERRPGFRLR